MTRPALRPRTSLAYAEATGLPADPNIATVPEPATIAVLAAGLPGLGLIRRRSV